MSSPSRWALSIAWVLVVAWAVFDAIAFWYFWWAIAPTGFDAIPSLILLYSIVLGQGAWLTVWCILKQGSITLRLLSFLIGGGGLAGLIFYQAGFDVAGFLGDAARFVAMCGFPFLMARRQGYLLTTQMPVAQGRERSQSQYSLLDLLLLTTSLAVVLATAGLPSVIPSSPVERLGYAALWAAPAWITVPGVLVPRWQMTIILWPILALISPVLGAVAGGSNQLEATVLSVSIGTTGLSLLLTTSILRTCGFRIRFVPT